MTVRTEAAGASQIRLTGRAAFLIGALSLLILLSLGPARAYLAQRAQIAQLERQTQVLEDANARLERQISRLHDPTELERLARECLGMVEPGETAFVTTPSASDC
ncbi:MAG: septum formation initiator family protein [Candidatus Velamenicoccus archaeovorus]